MYPFRIVVDTNCLNAKGRIEAMNRLEQFHRAGVIEIVVTSTLRAEVDRISGQAMKAKQYQWVGASYVFSGPDGSALQNSIGTPVRPSLLQFLHDNLFDPNLKGHALRRAIRDCLHLDQAQMNAADIFVTNDKKLHRAETLLATQGVVLASVTPEVAIRQVEAHVASALGSSDITNAKAHVEQLGPIIIGSNSFGSCEFTSDGERLASFKVQGGLLHIDALLRDGPGGVAVSLAAGRAPRFNKLGPRLTQVGRGPIYATEEPANAMVVASGPRVHLAVRMSNTGRAVIHGLDLCNPAGESVVLVRREILEMRGPVSISQ